MIYANFSLKSRKPRANSRFVFDPARLILRPVLHL
jgi:hypothetical protein